MNTIAIAEKTSALKVESKSLTRLASLDFMRGLIMVLLVMESSGLYEHLSAASEKSGINVLVQQFFHHPWNGLRFWDLVQPGFMFLAGVSMTFSLNRQWQAGASWNQSFLKTLKRSGWLFFWGVLDYAVRPTGLSFELWDVLTQLSFTTLVTFLVFRWSAPRQVLLCIGLLLLTEILYRFTNIPNFNQPFTDQHNFGNYMDLILMNKINPGGWVAINCIPTAVHTIAGTLAGKLMLNTEKKFQPLLIAAAICLVIGYGLDAAGITPIIKRIATSSFTIVSLGWCLIGLALCYWWIDIKLRRKHLQFFTIVGMNSIFIYIFIEIVGQRWFNEYVSSVTNGLMSMISIPGAAMLIVSSMCIFALEWSICWWLYKKKLFFKL